MILLSFSVKRKGRPPERESIISFPGFPGGSDSKESACMQETQVQCLGQQDPLEKGVATHPSILDWRIPWTKEPSVLQFMDSKRVRHN